MAVAHVWKKRGSVRVCSVPISVVCLRAPQLISLSSSYFILSRIKQLFKKFLALQTYNEKVAEFPFLLRYTIT